MNQNVGRRRERRKNLISLDLFQKLPDHSEVPLALLPLRHMARLANLSVLCVSSKLLRVNVTVQMMPMRALPERAGCRILALLDQCQLMRSY